MEDFEFNYDSSCFTAAVLVAVNSCLLGCPLISLFFLIA